MIQGEKKILADCLTAYILMMKQGGHIYQINVLEFRGGGNVVLLSCFICLYFDTVKIK